MTQKYEGLNGHFLIFPASIFLPCLQFTGHSVLYTLRLLVEPFLCLLYWSAFCDTFWESLFLAHHIIRPSWTSFSYSFHGTCFFFLKITICYLDLLVSANFGTITWFILFMEIGYSRNNLCNGSFSHFKIFQYLIYRGFNCIELTSEYCTAVIISWLLVIGVSSSVGTICLKCVILIISGAVCLFSRFSIIVKKGFLIFPNIFYCV